MPTGKTCSAPQQRKFTCPLWLRRLGLAGFAFFLAKGLLWIVAFVILGTWGLES